MRAICESCAQPQPVDWRAGDLCIHCGLSVREEARCYWCAKWGPAGKFCRKCGAAAVAREKFGAARILKHMGASVFEIPKLLAELDPELIATHQSIYATHAAAANRLIEYAREMGKSLYQKHWAAQLEEVLIPQLPWTDEQLERANASPLSEDSPYPLLSDLSHLVRINRGDFSKLRESTHLVSCGHTDVAAEAALQFAGWRALYCTYTEISRYDLIEVLRKSPLPEVAAPRLAALGAEPRPEYFPTGDADTDFLILILNEDTHALASFLDDQDSQRREVAAAQLVRLRQGEAIGSVLRRADEAQQLQLLRDIVRYKKPVPALHDDLFHIVENTTDSRICDTAAQAITLGKRHADALRLVGIANGNHGILHSLLISRPAPETYAEIGRLLVKSGHFNMNQWGWDKAAEPASMPVTFVEENFTGAPPETQIELLRFAEMQIEAHGVARSALERLLIRQCFARGPVELIGTAWACIHRIQMHRRVGLTVPCDLSLENVAWCWSMPEVLTAIAGLMANPKAVEQTFVRDDFDRFLRSAEDDFFQAAAAWPDECRRVEEAAPLADPYTYAKRFAESLKRR